ncbi:MAG: DUF6268 family outer membrane beta-barrel protein [Myxococcota bacterium]
MVETTLADAPRTSDERSTPRRSVALLAVTAMLLAPGSAAAQFPDLASVSAQYMGPVALEGADAEVDVTTFDVAANAPIPLAEGTFLIPGIAYRAIGVDVLGDTSDIDLFGPFHSIDVPVLFVQRLAEDWLFSLRASVSFAGDFADFDSSMMLFSAVSMVTHSFNDRFVLGAGLFAAYSFGNFLPLPALFVDWEPVDSLKITAFVPAFVDVVTTLGDRFEFGVRAEISGNSYGIRDASVTESWPCAARETDDPVTEADETVAQTSECIDNIAYSVVSLGVLANVRVASTLWLGAFGGRTVYRKFDAQNRSGDSLQDSQTLPAAFLFRLSLTWRIPEP